MLCDPVHLWLLRLCDPAGSSFWPARRLDPAGLTRLLRLADEHGVTGAVLANVNAIFAGEGRQRLLRESAQPSDGHALDAALRDARQRWFDFLAMTLSLRQRARQVRDAFRSAGVPAALVKGEDFADRLYRPSGLRPFRDIDLMLPREAMPDAARIMAALGYREVRGQVKYQSDYGEQTWDSLTAPRTRVELHWNLINSPAQRRHSSLTYESLQWEQTTLDGQPALRATPAAMLLIAAVHAVLGHRFDRLQHLCDIRQICRAQAGPVDVDWLRGAAAQCGTAASLQGALEVSARLLQDSAAGGVRQRLGLPVAISPWRWLVRDSTLLRPETAINKLRRTAVREWMKRAA
jgi:hypothetical protein